VRVRAGARARAGIINRSFLLAVITLPSTSTLQALVVCNVPVSAMLHHTCVIKRTILISITASARLINKAIVGKACLAGIAITLIAALGTKR